MQVIQQVNGTEGKGMRGKSPWVQTQVIHMISFPWNNHHGLNNYNLQSDTSQILVVSFCTSLLRSQTCYKSHKGHKILSPKAFKWFVEEIFQFEILRCSNNFGILIWTLCPIASAGSGLLGCLCRKVASIVDKTQICSSVLPFTTE